MNYSFQCIDCGVEYKKNEVEYVCPRCSFAQKPMEPTRGVLKVLFDYGSVAAKLALPNLGRATLRQSSGHGSAATSLLPLDDLSLLPPLKVGPTPLYKNTRLGEGLKLKNLYIKDDTVLPTGSFKDRASSLVVAKARELKKDTIVCASTGNAATALAGMCASVGMNCVIFVPSSAPLAKLTQIAVYGANLIPVKGTYDDAFELSLAATKEFGWYNRNTAYNPFTIEGKKTAALEIFEQLGENAPDKIFIPTGDGVILAGIYKGFWDLLQMDKIKKLPQLIAVQAEGSCVITKMFQGMSGVAPFRVRGSAHTKVCYSKATTIADSICVSVPRNANWAVKAIKETNGFGVTVSDKEIISAVKRLGSLTGIFAEPAGAASVAGLLKVAQNGVAHFSVRRSAHPKWCYSNFSLRQDETIVLLITGSGLKDILAAQKSVKIPAPIEPNLKALKK